MNDTKLSVKKPRRATLHQARFWMNAETEGQLRSLRDHYGSLLGRPVSTSVIMRRALGVLLERAESAQESRQEELTALRRVVL